MKHRLYLFILLTGLSLLAAPQSPAPSAKSLKFEVASLRPSPPGPHELAGVRPAPGGQRYVAENANLRLLIMVAYRVKAEQIVKGPAWMATDAYDMNAQAERPSSTEDLHLMLQDLIADRFKLQFHYETKELPIYALTVDKAGPKVQPHEAQNAGEPWIDVAFQDRTVKWHASFAPMPYFAWRLSMMLDRPVVDQTKLKGGYDFDISFIPVRRFAAVPDGGVTPAPPDAASGPTIFDAVRQQLGLKLEREKGPVQIMVVDHAEKPVDN